MSRATEPFEGFDPGNVFDPDAYARAEQDAFLRSVSGPLGGGGVGSQQYRIRLQNNYNKYIDVAGQEAQQRARDLASFTFDPNTGLGTSETALPSADIAPEVQARQDRLMRRLQQQKLADATDTTRGALGLMQSFRPGGGAALEAGIYGQVAASQRAEAAGFQPLDMMYNKRQSEADRAQARADKASKRSFLADVISGVGTVVGGIYGGAAGAAVGSQAGELVGGVQLAPDEPGAQSGAAAAPPQMTAGPVSVDPAGAPAATGTPARPDAPQGQLGIGADAPGASGDFSAASFAAASSRSYQDPMQGSVMQMAMNDAIADIYESDPFYPAFSSAVNNLLLGE